MNKLLEMIVSRIEKNIRNPRLYAVLIIGIAIIISLFPYIDANFLSFGRIQKRISILQSIIAIDTSKVAESDALQKEYDAILSEIASQSDMIISGKAILSSSSNKNVELWKMLSGGALAWIVTLCVPFMNTFKDRKSQILGFFLCAGVGALLGWIGYMIPTLFNPWINYVGFPVLQLLVLIALVSEPKKANRSRLSKPHQ